jgi:hypothetical protein
MTPAVIIIASLGFICAVQGIALLGEVAKSKIREQEVNSVLADLKQHRCRVGRMEYLVSAIRKLEELEK